MAKSRRNSDNDVKRLIDALLADPPETAFDIERRLKGFGVEAVRRDLADRLANPELSAHDATTVEVLLTHLGAGRQHKRLLGIASDERVAGHARAAAMRVVTHDADVTPDEFAKLAASPAMGEIVEDFMSNMVAAAAREPDVAVVVAELLEQLEGDVRMDTLQRLEEKRRAVGASAASVYSEALAVTADPQLRAFLLDRLVEEGGVEAVGLLEDLRNSASDAAVRHEYQRAFLRMKAVDAVGAQQKDFAKGRTFVSSCDGQGSFILLAIVDLPEGKQSLADLCIRASADIRDGFLLTREDPSVIRGVVDQVRSKTELLLVQGGLGMSLRLLEEALARATERQEPLPLELRPVVGFFQRIVDDGFKIVDAVPDPERVRVEDLAPVLRRPSFSAWFFDAGDLRGRGVKLPRRAGLPSAKWVSDALATLDIPPIQDRLVAMARHASRIATWGGNGREAALFAAAARDVAAEFTTAALPRIMLERYFAPSDALPDDPDWAEPSLRRAALTTTLFQETRRPRMRELAQLDFIQAAAVALDRAVDALPGETRLREPVMGEIATQAGRYAADAFRARDGQGTGSGLAKKVRALVTDLSGLPPVALEQVSSALTLALEGFRKLVCTQCPVHCLGMSREDATAWFSSGEHPAPDAFSAWAMLLEV